MDSYFELLEDFKKHFVKNDQKRKATSWCTTLHCTCSLLMFGLVVAQNLVLKRGVKGVNEIPLIVDRRGTITILLFTASVSSRSIRSAKLRVDPGQQPFLYTVLKKDVPACHLLIHVEAHLGVADRSFVITRSVVMKKEQTVSLYICANEGCQRLSATWLILLCDH